ncbi:MAG: class I SAM-dependent methyltransferase [Natronosporangium sp.]
MAEQSVGGRPVRETTLGHALAPYYSSGRFLQDKHAATPAAAQNFPNWVLDQLDLSGLRAGLDAGCGWGRFSVQLLRRLPPGGCQLVCADLYQGMLTKARETLTSEGFTASYVVSDIAALPFDDRRFDMVMANHVLYHAADLPGAVRELARVLTRAGSFVATTNSDAVRVPLLEIHRAVLEGLGLGAPPEEPSSFNMENATGVLSNVFTYVETHVYHDVVHYDSAEALLKVYLNTGRYRMVMADTGISAETRDLVAPTFLAHAQKMLTEQGRIDSPQVMCAFVCGGAATGSPAG